MASTSDMNIEGYESEAHLVPSQHIFHLSLENGITSLDVHLPQKLSISSSCFPFSLCFTSKIWTVRAAWIILKSSLAVHACLLDDTENAFKASSTVGGAGLTDFTGFDGGAKTKCCGEGLRPTGG